MKICVAIPAYDGKLPAETVTCLLREQIAALGGGDQIEFRFLPACSHPAAGRNQLVDEFLKSDADKLVFLDSDVTCEPGAIARLAKKPVDLVGGAYRFKWGEEIYPVKWIEGELWLNEHGLVEVDALPAGFLAISRNVFEKMREAHPERIYQYFGHPGHAYFSMPHTNGELYGEDVFFCREWRALGGKVFLDPYITLTHWDARPMAFTGNVGNWLKQRKENENGETGKRIGA